MKVFRILDVNSCGENIPFASEEAAMKYAEIAGATDARVWTTIAVQYDGTFYELRNTNIESGYGKAVGVDDVEDYIKWEALRQLAPFQKKLLGLE